MFSAPASIQMKIIQEEGGGFTHKRRCRLSVAHTMFRVAEELLAYCTKCRLDLMHVIVSMDRGVIVKSQCKSCGGVHGFRPPKGQENAPVREKIRRTSKSAGSTVKKGAAQPDSAEISRRWMELMAACADMKPRPYGIQERFAAGELISHPTFGKGVVVSVPGSQKMDVHFEGGIKLLAQGR